MVAADEMGHKGVRAMTPLDSTLANALRVKLGKGRELPEEPKPKRPSRAKKTDDAAASADGTVVKKAPPRKKKTDLEEAPVELRPAATIVKPKPADKLPETVEPVAPA